MPKREAMLVFDPLPLAARKETILL